ncbi:hypothetical protein Z950_782 [Sulfitobacter mediterraneus KCTC 32188]|nr:hypothetical protein Z950_782 [Sulfitobacter mediterraneus KCTC 32188]
MLNSNLYESIARPHRKIGIAGSFGRRAAKRAGCAATGAPQMVIPSQG